MKVSVYVLQELWHAKLEHDEGQIFISLSLNGADKGEMTSDAFFSGSKCEEVS